MKSMNQTTQTKCGRLIFLLILMFPLTLFAQPQKGNKGKPKRENIEAQKIAFITRELDLSSEEAQKFWPVYNLFSKDRQELRKQKRDAMNSGKKPEDLSDVELSKMMETVMAVKQKELDLEKNYHTKFLNVLPVAKVAKLYRAEEKFKRILLEKISKNGKGTNKGNQENDND